MKKLSKSGQYAAKKAEHKKLSVRAKVEHVFAIVKRLLWQLCGIAHIYYKMLDDPLPDKRSLF